jgi:very-short-patch-repair endonuclease
MPAFECRSKARRKAQLTGYAFNLRHGATNSECSLWAAIRSRALGVQFRRQVPIGGRFIGDFVGDFVASEIKPVVEVDGSRHVGLESADTHRDAKLQRLGYTVLRLSDLVEHQLPVALQRIREAVAALSVTP